MNQKFTLLQKKIFPFKIKLIYNISLIGFFDIIWPEYKLLTKYEEIEEFFDFDKSYIIKFLYFNKSNINKILYDYDQIISLDNFIINSNINLSDYFYLQLLIVDNPYIINYNYNIEIIRKINFYINNDSNNYNNNNIFKKILLSKINIDLINYYKEAFQFNENDSKEIKNLEISSLNIIEKNVNYFEDFNLSYKDILIFKIDKIYTNIIISLIKSRKFEDYDYIINIMNQLELESITITKYMFEKLKILLNKDMNIKYLYMILNVNDLFDIKKINFYYILFKYILKNSFYIYQISFLTKIKVNIINIVNNNLNQILYSKVNEDKFIKEKIEYVIKSFLDSEYYNEYLDSNKLEILKEVLLYYKNYLFESKKEKISLLEEIIKKKEIEKYYDYLSDYEKAKEMNYRFNIIKYLVDNSLKSEIEIKKYFQEWEKCESFIKQKSYRKIKNNIKIKLVDYFKNKNNKNILYKIFKEDDITYFIDLYSLNNEDNLNNNEINIKTNKDNIIKIKQLNSININTSKKDTEDMIEQSIYIQSLSSNTYNFTNSKIIKKENNKDIENIGLINDDKNISIMKEIESEILQLIIKPSKYDILEFIKIIGKHKYTAEFIKELTNNYFISGGQDGYLLVYNYLFDMEIKLDNNNIPYFIQELGDNNKIKIIVCCKEELHDIIFSPNMNSYKMLKYKFEDSLICMSFFETKKNNYIISGYKDIILFTNLFKHENIRVETILKKPFLTGIKIDSDFVIFASNSLIPKGEDKLIFYDINKNEIFKEIIGYSFIISPNCLTFVNQKILLCACKKYLPQQKNGILLINISGLKGGGTLKMQFYNTKDYEVYCFCPILIVNNENPINGEINNKEKIKLINTDYFLVGGFDIEKAEGIIRLYKVIYEENIDDIKIEYIQDINIEEKNGFEGFDGPISCIIQSTIIGNIIVTCWDGNVYLFKPPNIEYYLKNERK